VGALKCRAYDKYAELMPKWQAHTKNAQVNAEKCKLALNMSSIGNFLIREK